ncbi:MAG: alpha-glucan family phosphorylase, partial [Bacteroidetes bacterium]|nr:alpha-glucan family phosphorylase [Bacteroidota bacterium]
MIIVIRYIETARYLGDIMPFTFKHPYTIAQEYSRPVAYFCMEYAIAQPLKTYAGGLGFLAGSHLMSAYDLKQNMIAIGILWKYGYYEQVRKQDQTMDILFEEKIYGFLEPTGIKFTITVTGHPVRVTAWYLPPEIFHTAPLFLLSTDLEENDYLSRTICHKLYDFNPETKIAAGILLGVGGAKLLECLGWQPETYHLNESHALPIAFYLYARCKNLEALKKMLVFTNHTPEEGGNPRSDLSLLEKMGFFSGVPLTEVRAIAQIENNQLDHTRAALRMAGIANGVSKMHG